MNPAGGGGGVWHKFVGGDLSYIQLIVINSFKTFHSLLLQSQVCPPAFCYLLEMDKMSCGSDQCIKPVPSTITDPQPTGLSLQTIADIVLVSSD